MRPGAIRTGLFCVCADPIRLYACLKGSFPAFVHPTSPDAAALRGVEIAQTRDYTDFRARDVDVVWYSPAFGDACGKVPPENMLFRIAAPEPKDCKSKADASAGVLWK
jgi:hypothetical protein